MATFADVANQVKNLKEHDPVALKLIHQGHFSRTIHGFIKTTGTVPSMITDSGETLVIRPVMILDGRSYEFSSITKSS